MKSTKKTNKKFKPVFTVDLTKCEDAYDVLLAFAYAKHDAGLPITDDELDAIIDDNSIVCIIRETNICECAPKKKSWYKRFWNWITRKK